MLNKLFYILTLIVFASCSGEPATVAEDEEQQQIESVIDTNTIEADSYLVSNINYSWQGNLDGKYPVLIWYKEIGGVITGSLFYTDQKNKLPILLAGDYQDGRLILNEHMEDGEVTGIWMLEPKKHSIEGEWMNPITQKTLSASLMKIDSAVAIYGLSEGRSISGTYHYYYEDENYPTGNLFVEQIDADNAVIGFDNVGRGPAYNIGMIDADTVELSGNTIRYSLNGYGGCELIIKFFNEFAYVEYVDNKMSCGLGHNVYLNGTYVKIK